MATLGSCFAQHISRALVARGYNFLRTELPPPDGDEAEQSFSARFGNVYSARQLLQLFDRAFGLFVPLDRAWDHEGAFVDPFRPRIPRGGFHDLAALEAERRSHLACVRRMFEDCDVLIYTLGLTEAWESIRDGAVFPLAPGVAGGVAGPEYRFHNFSSREVIKDLSAFIRKFRRVNPAAKIVLTVSPVALNATYDDRHILVANTYSKAVLRAAADEIARSARGVFYFPSFEIISSNPDFLQPDRRNVTAAGVQHVMEIFERHCLDIGVGSVNSDVAVAADAAPVQLSEPDLKRLDEAAGLLCDEDLLDPAHGG